MPFIYRYDAMLIDHHWINQKLLLKNVILLSKENITGRKNWTDMSLYNKNQENRLSMKNTAFFNNAGY